MQIRTGALAKLIASHGVALIHQPPLSAIHDRPWTPEAQDTASGATILGVIQHIRAETNPRLPAGSLRALAVLKLDPAMRRPLPGDRLAEDSRIWTIETILPLMEDRRAVLVEAVLLTSGEVT